MDSDSQPSVRPNVVAAPGAGHTELLERLAIPIAEVRPEDAYLLAARQGALELRPPDQADRAGIHARFPPDADRRRVGAARAHPLVRAFGGAALPILDLTAGLGADAYRLAEAGHRVRGVERDPAVFALLASAWAEAHRTGAVPPAIAARLDFVHADASAMLDALGPEAGSPAGAREVEEGCDPFAADVSIGIYLDPMYPPPRKASALPRRELQVLRRLLAPSGDLPSLVARARARATRVVVKRPHHAPPVASGATFVVESKLVRFDVYLDPRRMGTKTA